MVNLFLDWLLIVHLRLGVWGGVGAIVGTFAITIPFRLWVVREIIGGVYFPALFFLRLTAVLAALGWGFHWLSAKIQLFERFDGQWVNLGFLFAIGVLYLAAFLLAIRTLRLIRKEDVREFEALETQRLNAVLAFLVK